MYVSSASTDPRRVGRMQRRRLSEKRWRGRLAGLSDGQTMMCVAADYNAHIGVVEP